MYSKEALFGNAPHLSTLFQAKKTNSARKKKKSLRTHTHTTATLVEIYCQEKQKSSGSTHDQLPWLRGSQRKKEWGNGRGSIGMESLCMCRIGAEGKGMLYIQQGIAKKKKSLRTHAHHYHGYHVPTEGKKKKKESIRRLF
jgi:hypothetical protein